MKKLIVAIFIIGLINGIGFAKGKTSEIEKYQAQLQALAQKRAQYVQAITTIEMEMIKVQAVIDYLTKDETDAKKKKEETKK